MPKYLNPTGELIRMLPKFIIYLTRTK